MSSGQDSTSGRRRNAFSRTRPVQHSAQPVHGRRTLRGVAAVLVFLLTFGTAGMALGYSRLQGNINLSDIGDYLGGERPTEDAGPVDPAAGRAWNVLVLGSDTREGENAGIDSSQTSAGMRADTTMLVNIGPQRDYVNVVSIPRDTLVDIPACRLPDGAETQARSDEMFNSAFAIGGQSGDAGSAAACAIRTVEALTGIYVHDFVVVDFTGFIAVVDALGGIAMYIPEDINDPAADLQLEAGCRLLNGQQALGLARVRKIGDGSDISRIGRQQEIVMEIIDEMLSTDLLTDPIRLYQVLDVSTQTLTTSPKIGSIPNLLGLASALAGIDSADIRLVTMPFDPAGNRVTVSADFVPYVWESILAALALDVRVSGAGYEIAAAGIPAWDETVGLAALTPEPTTPGTETGSEGATESPTEQPTAPEPAPVDPAASCTKETAS